MSKSTMRKDVQSEIIKTELKNLLNNKDYFLDLSDVDDAVASITSDGLFQTVSSVKGEISLRKQVHTVVTRTPDNRFFQWTCKVGREGFEDDEIVKNDNNEVILKEVKPVERKVIVTFYELIKE